ncbi:MAG: hypothetical protein B7Z10_03685 [Rhodobacterales bacterium 32-66-7]|nr:MAG: hypothetical protein B7Z10_03685 [Rhodobacterales bacterium 32-66-7]
MATITGTSGADIRNDTVGTSDSYDMLAGNDTVFAGAGNDTVFGGDDNDILEGGSGNDRLFGGSGDDYLYAGTFIGPDSDSLDGGGGNDTVDFSLGDAAVNLTLIGGAAVFNPPDEGNSDRDTLTGIEHIVGSNFADSITGDTVANRLFGGAGSDSLFGGDGADTLFGGNDGDSLSGGTGADVLFGGAGADTLFGGDQNDTLIGGAGADIIDGDGGTGDTASYVDSASGVVVTVNSIGTGGDAAGDTLVDIENLTGSNFSDALIGNGGNNVLDGGGGNDLLMGGLGNDTLIGGGDTDTASFAGSTTAVNASLATNIATGEGTDSLSGIENLVGTRGNDTLTGDDTANRLTGGLGNDTISAAGGNDTVLGGAGDDTVDGGSGNDLIYGGGTAETSANFIVNGGFTGLSGSNGGGNWTGTDLEFNPETAYFTGGGGTSNTVAEIDGNAGQITVMNQSFSVGEASSAQLTFRGILRTQGQVGLDGYRVDIVDASNNVIFSQTILPGSNVLPNWTNYTLNFDFPAAGTYTLRFTEIGDGDSLGALVDDVQITSIVDGADLLNGGDGNDTIYGGAGSDVISGDANDDLLSGDTGADSLSGGTGRDTLYGGVGQDTLLGDGDNDVLFGDAGNDSLDGGNGDDILRGGEGPDTMRGGAGNDVFLVQLDEVLGDGNDIVDGGGNAGEPISTDNDTIDFSVYGWDRVEIDYTSTDPLNLVGTITIYDANGKAGGVVIGRIDFNEIETLICFTPGTLILTDRGEVAVETLVPGDRVMTRDHGLQALRWVGKRRLSMLDLVAQPELRPVRIARGAFGPAGPDRAMLVSPQHRVLIEGAKAELLFGEAEVLVPAKHLVGQIEATRALPEEGVVYIHILFDSHEIVQSDGIWTESFQPAERTLSALDADVRAELFALFPELAANADGYDGARLSLKAHEARVLLAG